MPDLSKLPEWMQKLYCDPANYSNTFPPPVIDEFEIAEVNRALVYAARLKEKAEQDAANYQTREADAQARADILRGILNQHGILTSEQLPPGGDWTQTKSVPPAPTYGVLKARVTELEGELREFKEAANAR